MSDWQREVTGLEDMSDVSLSEVSGPTGVDDSEAFGALLLLDILAQSFLPDTRP
jgi:hypothetical protein